MKTFLKITIYTLVIFFLFRGFLYRQTINYTPVKEIKSIPIVNKELIAAIDTAAKDKSLNLLAIAEIASSITQKQLQFTFQKASNNPNVVAQTGKANCMGYAAMFSAIAKYLIDKHHLEEQLEVKHLVGKMDFLSIDLHQFFASSFFSNHDYNVIEDKELGTVFLIDTSLDDYLYLGGKYLK